MKKLLKELFSLENLKRAMVYSAFAGEHSPSYYSFLSDIIRDMDAKEYGEKIQKVA